MMQKIKKEIGNIGQHNFKEVKMDYRKLEEINSQLKTIDVKGKRLC